MSLVSMIDDYQRTTNLGDKVATFFDAMNMPIPEAEEYEFSADDGFLLFLDEPACVMRGSNITICPSIQNDYILQPLLSRKITNDFRIDIFPGVVSPIKDGDVWELKKQLRKYSIEYFDEGPFNAGYIPVSSVKFPDGIPVVIDAGSVRKINETTSLFQRLLMETANKNADECLVQSSAYSDLRHAFQNAWPQKQSAPDQHLLRKAWDLCVKKKGESVTLESGRKQNILTADWQSLGQEGKMNAEYKNAKHGGASYAQSWSMG
jgi:hypothetical protein